MFNFRAARRDRTGSWRSLSDPENLTFRSIWRHSIRSTNRAPWRAPSRVAWTTLPSRAWAGRAQSSRLRWEHFYRNKTLKVKSAISRWPDNRACSPKCAQKRRMISLNWTSSSLNWLSWRKTLRTATTRHQWWTISCLAQAQHQGNATSQCWSRVLRPSDEVLSRFLTAENLFIRHPKIKRLKLTAASHSVNIDCSCVLKLML